MKINAMLQLRKTHFSLEPSDIRCGPPRDPRPVIHPSTLCTIAAWSMIRRPAIWTHGKVHRQAHKKKNRGLVLPPQKGPTIQPSPFDFYPCSTVHQFTRILIAFFSFFGHRQSFRPHLFRRSRLGSTENGHCWPCSTVEFEAPNPAAEGGI